MKSNKNSNLNNLDPAPGILVSHTYGNFVPMREGLCICSVAC